MASLWKHSRYFRSALKSFNEIQVRFISKNSLYFFKVSEERMEDLQKNPYFEKYSKKIAKIQNEDEEAFKKKLEDMKQKKEITPKNKDDNKFIQQSAKPNLKQPEIVKAKKLDEVLKLDLIEDKSSDEIAEIWKKYHSKDNYLNAVIESGRYKIIEERSKRFNTFLFPLPRDQGYEFIICQFQNNECHFTTLLNYQTYKENAPECLTLIHFSELSETKGIVLMQGEYHKEVINAIEAQCLINQLQLYYAEEDPKKTRLLEKFSLTPEQFKHSELIDELQNSITQ